MRRALPLQRGQRVYIGSGQPLPAAEHGESHYLIGPHGRCAGGASNEFLPYQLGRPGLDRWWC